MLLISLSSALPWEVTLKRELLSLGEAINSNTLEDREASVAECRADLRASVDELKTATPQTPEEWRKAFLRKKQFVDTLVDQIPNDKERNLQVQILLNLLDTLGKDARTVTNAGVQNREGEIYTRIRSTHIRMKQMGL